MTASSRHQSTMLPTLLPLLLLFPALAAADPLRGLSSGSTSRGGSCPPGQYLDKIVNSCESCEHICDPARGTEADCQEHIHACNETLQQFLQPLPVIQALIIETIPAKTTLRPVIDDTRRKNTEEIERSAGGETKGDDTGHVLGVIVGFLLCSISVIGIVAVCFWKNKTCFRDRTGSARQSDGRREEAGSFMNCCKACKRSTNGIPKIPIQEVDEDATSFMIIKLPVQEVDGTTGTMSTELPVQEVDEGRSNGTSAPRILTSLGDVHDMNTRD